LAKSKFLRSVFAISSGTVAAQLLLILFTPVLTRLYLPADFGVFAVFTSLLSILSVASSLRYEIAIPLPKLQQHAVYIVILSCSITVLTSSGTILLVVLFSDQIAAYTRTPLLNECLWLLPLGVLCLGTYKIFNFWAIRNNAYNNIARTKIIQNIAGIITQLATGLLSLGAIGLIAGRMFGQGTGAFLLAGDFNLRNAVGQPKRLLKKIWATARIYRNFPKFDVLASFINTLNIELPQLVLAFFFGSSIAGYYLLVNRVLAIPASLIGQAVGQVYYGNWKNFLLSGDILTSTLRIVSGLCALIAIPAVIIFFCSSYIFPLVFGCKWDVAGVYASWLVFGFAAQFIYSPISLALMATGGQKVNLFLNLAMLLLKAVGGGIGIFYNDALLTIQLFSFTSMAVYLLGVAVVIFRVRSVK
jgi:O-antigen/teichoic acid export membrane protein